jgi:hypothetical protein
MEQRPAVARRSRSVTGIGFETLASRQMLAANIATGPSQVAEGAPYVLQLNTKAIGTWTINWGDGQQSTVNQLSPALPVSAANHIYADGSASYAIKATFKSGTASQSKSIAVKVLNVAPQVAITGNLFVYSGSTYRLERSQVIDPGRDTISKWVVDWGHGRPETYPGSATSFKHNYGGYGSAQVKVTAVDEDGSYQVYSAPVYVASGSGSIPYWVNDAVMITALKNKYGTAVNEGYCREVLKMQIDEWRSLGYNIAANHMEHFLKNSGLNYDGNASDKVEAAVHGYAVIEAEIAKDIVEALWRNPSATSVPINILDRTVGWGLEGISSNEWFNPHMFNAYGGAELTVRGTATRRSPYDDRWVVVNATVIIADTYDWSPTDGGIRLINKVYRAANELQTAYKYGKFRTMVRFEDTYTPRALPPSDLEGVPPGSY